VRFTPQQDQALCAVTKFRTAPPNGPAPTYLLAIKESKKFRKAFYRNGKLFSEGFSSRAD
jgi:hypothetical protein